MKIKISKTAKYQGQTMKWTEIMYPEKAQNDFYGYHCSEDFIPEFLEKETCFFNEDFSTGHVYRYLVPKGTVYMTDGSEVRTEIKGEMEYMGYFKLVGTGEKERKYSSCERRWIEREKKVRVRDGRKSRK